MQINDSLFGGIIKAPKKYLENIQNLDFEGIICVSVSKKMHIIKNPPNCGGVYKFLSPPKMAGVHDDTISLIFVFKIPAGNHDSIHKIIYGKVKVWILFFSCISDGKTVTKTC